MSQGAAMLKEAFRTVEERGKVYGPAKENMERTAKLWSVVMKREVTAMEVALCLVQLKVARLVESPDHADSVLDIAGYAAIYRDCIEEKSE